jgi:CDP-diacylglycerol--glycerol-3-phosphate 3-phosphatidyltransferase
MQEIYCRIGQLNERIGKTSNNLHLRAVSPERPFGFYAAAIDDVAELLSLGGISSHAVPDRLRMNLPNSITMSRVACVPLLIWILSPAFPWTGGHGAVGLRGGEQEVIAAIVFILASITDGLDGYLARRRQQITTMGMLLDPLADKLMVSSAFIILVAYNPRVVPPWIAVLVIGREFLVSGLRSIAATEGFTIEASEIGKLKTVIQIVSVVAAILAHRWDYWNWGGFIVGVHFIAVTAIYWMVIVSIISAVDYFVGFWKKIDHASDTRRNRRSFVLSRKKKAVPPTEHPSRIS